MTVLTKPRPRHRKGIHVHEHHLDVAEVCVVEDIRLTSVPRTWFDLAGMYGFTDLVALTDQILRKGLATLVDLEQAIKPGHRGRKNARRSLLAADGRAASPGETRMRLILHAPGIAVVSQFEILDDFGFVIARADFALVELMIAIEYDGGHHLDRDQQRRDLDRVRTMERRGWRVLRYGAEDLRDRQQQMIAEIRAAIRERSP